jgi:hypothetical protein
MFGMSADVTTVLFAVIGVPDPVVAAVQSADRRVIKVVENLTLQRLHRRKKSDEFLRRTTFRKGRRVMQYLR